MTYILRRFGYLSSVLGGDGLYMFQYFYFSGYFFALNRIHAQTFEHSMFDVYVKEIFVFIAFLAAEKYISDL